MPANAAGQRNQNGLGQETESGSRVLVAPIALRMPISRMRDVTVASMMFMMPMPLTSSVTSATSIRITVRASAIRPATVSKLRQILHAVDRLSPMARLQHALDRSCRRDRRPAGSPLKNRSGRPPLSE